MPTLHSCAFCGASFQRATGRGNNNQKYCGAMCAKHAKREKDGRRARSRAVEQPERPCKTCGARFTGRANQVYCSGPCKRANDRIGRNEKKRAKSRARRKPKACGWCGEPFVPHTYTTRFCSDACRHAYRGNQLQERTCVCGDSFTAVKGSSSRYCSDACRWRYGRAGLRPSQVNRGERPPKNARRPASYVEKTGERDKYTFTTRVLDKSAPGVYYSESEFWSQLSSFRRALDWEQQREGDHGYQSAIKTYGEYTPDRGVERPVYLE